MGDGGTYLNKRSPMVNVYCIKCIDMFAHNLPSFCNRLPKIFVSLLWDWVWMHALILLHNDHLPTMKFSLKCFLHVYYFSLIACSSTWIRPKKNFKLKNVTEFWTWNHLQNEGRSLSLTQNTHRTQTVSELYQKAACSCSLKAARRAQRERIEIISTRIVNTSF